MNIRGCTRERDEEVLAMLAARAAGVPDKIIARRFDVSTENNVRQLIYNVRSADLRESGEPPAEILGHYGKRCARKALGVAA